MPNPYFRFKRFLIKQDQCAMKVNTDGVLLALWSSVNHANTALDIGTGTGVIACLLADRNPCLTIDAIEIDEFSALQAQENVRLSPFTNRITVQHVSLQHFLHKPSKSYDLVISNPPFFTQSLKSTEPRKTVARHNDSLLLQSMLEAATILVGKTGKLSLIYPPSESETFEQLAKAQELYCTRKLLVYPTQEKPVHRILTEFQRSPQLCVVEQLVLRHHNSKDYTEEYKQLIQDYFEGIPKK